MAMADEAAFPLMAFIAAVTFGSSRHAVARTRSILAKEL